MGSQWKVYSKVCERLYICISLLSETNNTWYYRYILITPNVVMHCHDISTSNLQNRFLNQKCILRTIFKLLAIVVSFSICGNAEFNPTERYIHTATLRSGNLKIYWKFNDSDITFEVNLQANSYRSIGLTGNQLY